MMTLIGLLLFAAGVALSAGIISLACKILGIHIFFKHIIWICIIGNLVALIPQSGGILSFLITTLLLKRFSDASWGGIIGVGIASFLILLAFFKLMSAIL